MQFRFIRSMLAGAAMLAGLSSIAQALEAPYDHYVFVPNRNSANVAIIDADTDTLVATVKVGNVPHQVAVSDTLGKMIASNTEDNTISVINLKTLKPEATIRLGNEPEHMEIAPNGAIAAVGNIGEGTVSLIDLRADREIRRIAGLHEPHNMTFSPDGKLLYVGNLGANFVSVIDVAKGKVIDEIPVGDEQQLAALPGGQDDHQGVINVTRTVDGRLGFAAHGDGDVLAIIDLRTRRKLKTLKLGDLPWRAYTTADSRYMIVPNNGDQTVSIFSTVSPFREVARLRGAADMTGVNTGWVKDSTPETGVTNPEGTKLYVALSGRNAVAVIDTRARKLIKYIKGVGEEPWGAHMVGALNYCH